MSSRCVSFCRRLPRNFAMTVASTSYFITTCPPIWPSRLGRTVMAEQAQHGDLEWLWEEHIRHEFSTRSTDDTLKTMVEDAYVDHVPVLTGGSGETELRQFYETHFIPKMPPDMEMTPISRTIGTDQLVDEMVIKFTHSIAMDWMLPSIQPTGRRGEVPLAVIVQILDGQLAHGHADWDVASGRVP